MRDTLAFPVVMCVIAFWIAMSDRRPLADMFICVGAWYLMYSEIQDRLAEPTPTNCEPK